MSLEAQDWAYLLPLKGNARKSVLLGLCKHANAEGASWPKVGTLALYTGLSERGVQKALRELEAIGLVRCQPHPVYGASTYWINFAWVEGEQRAPCDMPGRVNGVHPKGEPGAPVILKEPSIEESPPQRAGARARGGGGLTHPKTGRKLWLPLPEDWQPSEANRAYARSLDAELDRTFDVEVDKFRKYYLRNRHKADTDWCRRFGEWLDKAATEFRKANPRDPVPLQSRRRGPVQHAAARAAQRDRDLDEQERAILADDPSEELLVESHPQANGRIGG